MNWKITKGRSACHGCEDEFEEKQTIYSAIEIENDEILRFDFCETCFKEKETKENDVYWKTQSTHVKKEKKVVSFEVLRDLFYKMLKVDEQDFKNLNYLLGLILVRKKYLQLKDFVSIDGVDFMVVRQKKDAPLINVEVPFLKEEDIVQLKGRLAELFDADLDSSMEINEIRDKIVSKDVTPPEEETPATEGADNPEE